MTLLAAGLAMGVAMVVGVPTGLIAGYYGGWFDAIASWWTNVLMSLPAIIVLLAATAALGKTVWVSMGIFGLLMSPGVFRLTRTTVQAVRNELYVDAARVAGLSDLSIIGKHILFVVRAPMIIQAAVIAGIAISIQAMLEFLGLGDPLVPTWGVMLNEGFVNIYTAPILTLWPGVAISLTIGSFVVFGNALRDALEDSPSAHGKAVRRPMKAVVPLDQSGASRVSDHLLEVRDLGIGYPQPGDRIKEVVGAVSLYLDRGEVLGVVGESGSGKTQTAFSVLGLLPQEAVITHGSIVFDGQPLLAVDDGRIQLGDMGRLRGSRIGYIPQEPMSNLDPNFTVGHQLVRPMRRLLAMSRSEATARALELLTIVGIPDPRRTFDAYPHQISGGMAQRVLIAGAVSCNPDLLIADEPTTALDVTVQAEVLDLLRELQRRFEMGVLLVTHNFGVVADVCDRVVVMQNGRLVEAGGRAQHHARSAAPLHQVAARRDARGQDADDDARPAGLARTHHRTGGMMSAITDRRSDAPDGPLLAVDDLIVEFPGRGFRAAPFRALDRVSISIGRSETLGLVGESGSGKTTLGRAILGLAPVTSGRISFAGRDISHTSRRERRLLSRDVQVVFQDPYTSLNPSMSVGDILAEPLRCRVARASRPGAGCGRCSTR